MTREDIVRMAREAGIRAEPGNSFADDMYFAVLYRFANIVAAAERAAIHDEFTTRMQKDLEGGCNPDQLEQIAPELAYFGNWLVGRARSKT